MRSLVQCLQANSTQVPKNQRNTTSNGLRDDSVTRNLLKKHAGTACSSFTPSQKPDVSSHHPYLQQKSSRAPVGQSASWHT